MTPLRPSDRSLEVGDLVRYKYEGEELAVVIGVFRTISTYTDVRDIKVRFLMGIPHWWDQLTFTTEAEAFTLVEDPDLPGKTTEETP